MKKGTKLYSIIKFKCPSCHEGNFFISHPYNLKNTGDVLDKCPKCYVNYMLETGFYQGALYVAYGLGVALFLLIWLLCTIFFPLLSVWIQISLVAISSILLGPLLFSLSKIIWANFFIPLKTNG
jgi:uncharacterized protein (DUF983 family)